MNAQEQNHNNMTRTSQAQTKREKAWAFLRDHIRQHGYPASRDQIAHHLGFKAGSYIHRYVAYFYNHRMIEFGKNGSLIPTLDTDDLAVAKAITHHLDKEGYPPRIDDIQARTQLDQDSIVYALRLLKLKRIIRWDESKPRGIHWKKTMPHIKEFHDMGSRTVSRLERIDALKAELPTPAPANIIPLPAPVQELHVPAKINANGVFSVVSTNMSYHTAVIEDICGSVSDYACNILRVRHDDPARAEVFEVAIRALINLAAEMVGASAYLVFTDQDTPEDQTEDEQPKRAIA